MTAALSHTDSQAVRFYVQSRLTEWGAGVRKALEQGEILQHHTLLTSLLSQSAGPDEDGAGLLNDRRGGSAVSLTARWLLRPEQGRKYLGRALAEMLIGAQKQRVIKTIAGVFPCRALLHLWGKAPSPQCLLCSRGTETVAHLQSRCWCPKLKEAHIAGNLQHTTPSQCASFSCCKHFIQISGSSTLSLP